MKITSTLLVTSIASLFLTGCVSTSTPTAANIPTPDSTVSPNANATAIPTLVVHGTPSPTVSTTKGTKIMTATIVDIKTDKGLIEIELYPQDAPKTVENFATLVSQGYYNGLTFHRVVEGFVIQGGDPTGTGSGGTSIYGSKFADELNPDTASYKAGYKEGVVAMANSGPNTNGSQFFIMLADTPLPHAYSIFGKVTKGLDVVHQIVQGDKMQVLTIVK